MPIDAAGRNLLCLLTAWNGDDRCACIRPIGQSVRLRKRRNDARICTPRRLFDSISVLERAGDFEREIARVGERCTLTQKDGRIVEADREREQRRNLDRTQHRIGEIVEGPQHQLAQDLQRLRFEAARERAFDVVLLNDFARAQACFDQIGRCVERDDLIGGLQE